MKTKLAILLLVAMLGASCKKMKKPKVCIDGPTEVEMNQEVTYRLCGESADKLEWSGASGTSTGDSYTVRFTYRGPQVIQLRAKRKLSGWTEESLTVNVGQKSKTWISLYDQCLPGGSTISNNSEVSNYHGYIYDSRAQWAADALENTHARCLDSTGGFFSSEFSNVGLLFNGNYGTGERYVSVEYRSPNFPGTLSSNWYEMMHAGSSGGVVNISNTPYQDNNGYATVDNSTRHLLTGKWMLKQITIGSNSSNPQACNADDYIRFYPDHTWTYHTGADNCNGESVESKGTYSFSRYCRDSFSGMSMTTTSGPFAGFSGVSFESQLTTMKIYASVNQNSVVFEFLRKTN